MMPPNETGPDALPLADGAPTELGSVDRCRAALDRARVQLGRRGPIDIRLLRQSVGGEVARSALDACLLRLEAEGAVSLTPHARPEALDRLELADCVPSPRGPLYFVTWRG